MAARIPVQKTEHTKELDELVGAWFTAANELASISKRENEARVALYRHFYKEGDKKASEDGTEKFEMPGGWVLEITRRLNVKIDEALLDAAKKVIAELPADPETGELATIDTAVKYKPQLTAGYDNLRGDVKEILSEALTFTPGLPAIKLVQKQSGN